MPKFVASARKAPKDKRVADVDPAQIVHLTVVLHPGAPIAAAAPGGEMSHAEYAHHHATKQTSIDAVTAFATAHGLTVVSADPATHLVKLSGTYAQAIAALTPDEIGVFEGSGKERYVARTGHLHLPHALISQVVAVMGMDQRPVAHPHFRRSRQSGPISYTPAQVAAHYEFPSGLTGAGQTVALIELGGGYTASQVASYFSHHHVTRTGTLASVSVDGAENTPGDPNGADGEVQLDIEVVGSVAPGAHIAVYFGPNQGAGFHDAIAAAVNDQKLAPSVISISWGGPEASYSQQDINAFEQVFQQAAALGITVCAASGDSGSSDGVTDGANHVDFPAASPSVLGCGGTSLPKEGHEVAWNDGAQGGASGGGYSTLFALPAWQAHTPGLSGKMRGVPDVAGDADPETGYKVSVDGKATVIGGTSAVAPLWAGLLALINQSTGKRAGFVNPVLYANAAAFTDITSGNNGAFAAGPGWDPVTGLGSPVGKAVLAALAKPAAVS